MKKQSKMYGLGAIVLIVIIMLLANTGGITSSIGGVFTLAANDYGTGIQPGLINNCNTIRYKEDVWTGQSMPGAKGYPNTELLDKTVYPTGTQVKFGTGKITMQGNLYENAFVETNIPDRAYYNVYLMTKQTGQWKKIIGLNYIDKTLAQTSDSIGWQAIKYSNLNTGESKISARPLWFCPKENTNGAIKVEYVAQFHGFWRNTWEKVMSVDFAFLYGTPPLNYQLTIKTSPAGCIVIVGNQQFISNANGIASFTLAPGTYAGSIAKSGYASKPISVTITKDASLTYTLAKK